MKLYKCPDCGRPAPFDTSLSDADTVKCGCCGYTSYLSAFNGLKTEEETVSAPIIDNDVLNSIANIAFGMDTGNTAASLEGYVKQLCTSYKLSPWTVIELVNAYMALRTNPSAIYNPRRFAQLQPSTVSLDQLLQEVRKAAAAPPPPAQPEPKQPVQSSNEEESIWHNRYLELQKKYEKLDHSDNQLLIEYKKLLQQLQAIKNQYGI